MFVDVKRIMSILTLYLCGLMQGFVMVGIPASGLFLRQDLGLTDAQYSMLFLPQLAMAIIGAFFGTLTTQRVNLNTVLILGVLSNTAAQFLMFYAGAGIEHGIIFPVLMLASAFIGLGFGLCSAPLSTLPTWLFPHKASSSMVALHAIVGIGFMLGPQFVSNLTAYHSWSVFPMWVTILGLTLLLNLLFVSEFKKPVSLENSETVSEATPETSGPWKQPVFWMGLILAILYAFCEATLSNWAVIFLNEEKHIPKESAAWALSGFWAGLTMGRLLISGMVAYFPAVRIWQVLPFVMLLPYLLINFIQSPGMGAFVFILGGLACSAFFPLTIRVLSEYFPRHAEQMASLTTAALMIGIGLGSYVLGPLRSLTSLSVLYQCAIFYPLIMVLITQVGLRIWPPPERMLQPD